MKCIKEFTEICAKFTPAQKLAEEVKANKPKELWKDIVSEYLYGFKDIFSKKSSEHLPLCKLYGHLIDLTVKDDELPHPSKVYPLSPVETKALNDFLNKNLTKGYIWHSKSSVEAPVFFVKKKDSSLQFVQDYCTLNKFMQKNRYPLLYISSLINALKGASIFTKLDLR